MGVTQYVQIIQIQILVGVQASVYVYESLWVWVDF